MAKPPRPKSKRRGCLRFVVVAAALLCVLAAWRTRDRHRGYALDLTLAPPPGHVPELRAGFARRSIAPELPDTWVDVDANGKFEPEKGDTWTDGNGNQRFDAIYIAGFGNNRPAAGILEDIQAIAAVFDDGAHRVGIVALDAIGFFHDDVITVRELLPPEWGIDYLLVCSTHCHEVPDLMGIWGRSPLRSGVNPAYRRLVIERTVEAVGAAAGSLQPVRMSLYSVPDLREGLVNDTRRPDVPDPDLRLARFTARDGSTVGTLLGWANHPETLWDDNLLVAPDFVGPFRSGVEQGLAHDGREVAAGTGGVALFLNGAIGGLLTPSRGMTITDPLTGEEHTEPTRAKSDALGRNVALAALEAMHGPARRDPAPALWLRAKTLRLRIDNPLFRLAPLLGVIDRGFTGVPKVRSEVALLRLGGAWFLAVPGEVYPEIVNGRIENPAGADHRTAPVEVPPWRERMTGQLNFVIGMANDEVGYIIPKSEWDTRGPEYLYGADHAPYGEINSLGPETAPTLHRAVMELFDAAGAQP